MATNSIVPKVTGAFSSSSVYPGKAVTFKWSSTPTSTVRMYLTGSNIDFVPSYALAGSRVLTVPMSAKVGTRVQVNWVAVSSTGNLISGSATATVIALPISPDQVIYPIVSLSTRPSTESIFPKQSATISWQSSDATKLTLSAPGWTTANVTGNLTANTLNGNLSVIAPETPAVYNIKVTATSPTGFTKDFNFPVKVTGPVQPTPTPIVPVVIGGFTPNTVYAGGNTQLSWSTVGVSNMLLSSNDLNFRANTVSGNTTVNVPITFTGNRVVVNYTAGTADAQQRNGSFVLPIVPYDTAPPTTQTAPKVTFTVTMGPVTYDPVIRPIEPSKLFTVAWTSTNANTLSVIGMGLNSNALSGAANLTAPGVPGDYFIRVNVAGPGGTANYSEKFTVGLARQQVEPAAIPVINVQFNPPVLNMGGITTLTWNVTNAEKILMNSTPLLNLNSTSPNGSSTVSISTPGNYFVQITAFSNTAQCQYWI